MIVYLARDIPAFVMYCVNGESDSSLLIESTDSMIIKQEFLLAIASQNHSMIIIGLYYMLVIFGCRTATDKILKKKVSHFGMVSRLDSLR